MESPLPSLVIFLQCQRSDQRPKQRLYRQVIMDMAITIIGKFRIQQDTAVAVLIRDLIKRPALRTKLIINLLDLMGTVRQGDTIQRADIILIRDIQGMTVNQPIPRKANHLPTVILHRFISISLCESFSSHFWARVSSLGLPEMGRTKNFPRQNFP